MKIAYIVPGSGDTFYCENCLRDMVLIKALKECGHDVTVVPMYLPFFLDSPDISSETPVFFGGLNVYLQQKFKFFRSTPRWLDKMLDSSWLLKLIAKRADSTRADGLGDMTLSMLKGQAGNQAKELERLTEWLKESEQPDIVHISNALLSGIAAYVKQQLSVPVVCSLQDEDGWLDSIDKPYDKLCWDAIATQGDSIDAFISVSSYYAEIFGKRTGLPENKIHTVHIGINTAEYKPAAIQNSPPTIGFLARMSPSLGLETLVDAFILLKSDKSFHDTRLRLAGGAIGNDIPFIRRLKRKLTDKGIRDDADFIVDFDKQSRLELLQSLSVLSVPIPSPSAFGTYIIESLASGVPVVQPDEGSFPELIETSEGGILYKPNDPEALADALKSVLNDQNKLRDMGSKGREYACKHFDVKTMASGIAKVYPLSDRIET